MQIFMASIAMSLGANGLYAMASWDRMPMLYRFRFRRYLMRIILMNVFIAAAMYTIMSATSSDGIYIACVTGFAVTSVICRSAAYTASALRAIREAEFSVPEETKEVLEGIARKIQAATLEYSLRHPEIPST